ncbi:MAG: hypothetical protein R6U52_00530 [Kosmotogaceae bacterium]
MVIIIILFFGAAIAYAYKVELHFQYNKHLNPKRYGKVSSTLDAITKFKFINPKILLPLFLNRNRNLEKGDLQLSIIASRIIRASWFLIALTLL